MKGKSKELNHALSFNENEEFPTFELATIVNDFVANGKTVTIQSVDGPNDFDLVFTDRIVTPKTAEEIFSSLYDGDDEE